VVSCQSFKQKRSRSFENKSATQALLDRLRYEDFDAGRGVRYPRCNYDGPTEEVSTFGLGVAEMHSDTQEDRYASPPRT
jgi:hypothetical protein